MIEIRLSIIPEETTLNELRHFVRMTRDAPGVALAFKRDERDSDFYDACVTFDDNPSGSGS